MTAPTAPVYGAWRAPGDRTPRCPDCRVRLLLPWCIMCGWTNGVDQPDAVATDKALTEVAEFLVDAALSIHGRTQDGADAAMRELAALLGEDEA